MARFDKGGPTKRRALSLALRSVISTSESRFSQQRKGLAWPRFSSPYEGEDAREGRRGLPPSHSSSPLSSCRAVLGRPHPRAVAHEPRPPWFTLTSPENFGERNRGLHQRENPASTRLSFSYDGLRDRSQESPPASEAGLPARVPARDPSCPHGHPPLRKGRRTEAGPDLSFVARTEIVWPEPSTGAKRAVPVPGRFPARAGSL